MKRKTVAVLLFMGSFVMASESQEFNPGNLNIHSISISEVSSVIELAPGLSILEAYQFGRKSGADTNLEVDFGDDRKLYFSQGYRSDGNKFLNEYTMFIEGVYRYEIESNPNPQANDQELWYVCLYNIKRGLSLVAWRSARYPSGFVPSIAMTEMSTVNFSNNKLLIILVYAMGNTHRDAYVLIGGDWNQFMDGDYIVSADLNMDGVVDGYDLLLFNKQWKTHR